MKEKLIKTNEIKRRTRRCGVGVGRWGWWSELMEVVEAAMKLHVEEMFEGSTLLVFSLMNGVPGSVSEFF